MDNPIGERKQVRLLQQFLTSLARHGLTALFGLLVLPLVARNLISAELATEINTAMDGWAAILVVTLITAVAPIALSWWNKVVAAVRERMALNTKPTVLNPEALVTKKTQEIPLPEKFNIAFGGEK